MIDVDALSVSFGDVDVFEDVSLSVEEGTFIGLVGPNGAGKTTLLRTIAGAIDPDRGTVEIDGADVHELPSRASSRLVSVVPQDTSVSFGFAVRDVVEMGRHPYRSRFSPPTREDRTVVDRALERTRTETLADRGIDEVSGGERRRVLLARSIAQDTPVVLLDEPTANLDVNHQVETFELVSSLVESGRTVVGAIHDLELAARYCDELAVLADGGLLETGPPDRVLRADLVDRAFDASAVVTRNPVTDSPAVTALPRSATESAGECPTRDASAEDRPIGDTTAYDRSIGGASAEDRPIGDASAGDRSIEDGSVGDATADDHPLPDRVHVVGSGATAAGVVARLAAAGVDASLGPVGQTDLAAATARDVGAETIEVEPFAPVTDETVEATADAVGEAAAVVLADLDLVAGNQRVLDPIADAEAIVVVERTPAADRLRAGAEAERRYAAVRERAVPATLETVVEAVAESALDGSADDPWIEAEDD